MDKKQVRAAMSEMRGALPPDTALTFSLEIAERLFSFPPFERAASVMLFVPFRSEVDTAPIIAGALSLGKRLVVPVSLKETREILPCEIFDPEADLAPGAYGIMEPPPERRRPFDPQNLEFVCVPGLAFDRRGNRVGYGGGYYDKFLRKLGPAAVTAALAYSFQVVDAVPSGGLDRKLRFIITEKETISCAAPPAASPF